MTAWSEFLNHQGRPVHKWLHYFTAYERHFARFVNQPLLFIEIGCGRGGSLQMWKKYFGPDAQIVGIDIHKECKEFEEEHVAVRIGSQADTEFLGKVLAEFGTPDIVLDDGSHHMNHVVTTFNYLFQRTSPKGVYMVEDLHTAYWEDFEGGLGRPGTFVEICKSLTDELNAGWGKGAPQPTDFSRSALSIHFYNSIIAIERGRLLKTAAPMIPPPADWPAKAV
jgi:SAM-dependent methyltransferase